MEELTPALQGKTKTTFSFPAPSSVCDCSAPHLGRKILHFLPRVMGSCGRVWSRGGVRKLAWEGAAVSEKAGVDGSRFWYSGDCW